MHIKILKRRYKNAIEILSERGIVSLLVAIYNYFWKTPAGALVYWFPRGRILWRDDSGWVLKSFTGGNDWHFPQIRDNYRFADYRRERLKEVYFDSDEVSVGKGDIVFEIGAYIGVTSQVAAELAEEVYAIEPSPTALPCLRKNLKPYDNVEVIHCAAWNESGETELQHGMNPSEDSLITPDDDGSGSSSLVELNTVENLAEERGIGRLDFLKVEAEGVEPEICEGIGDLDISKLSCACGEERHGDDVQDEVAKILEKKGFELFVKPDHPDKMVYATK